MSKHNLLGRRASLAYVVLLSIASVFAVLPAVAQSTGGPRDYSSPKSQFPDFLSPYTPRTVPEPNYANSPLTGQLVKDGKIVLSIDDAIALALENNLDLAIARYNLQIADTDLLRTKAGGQFRGVPTGLVQGTLGGGVGGLGTGAPGAGAGGTSAGVGGAGAGLGGLVNGTLGTGTPVQSFDPQLTGSIGVEHYTEPQANTILTGVGIYVQHTTSASFAYNQAWSTGTSMQVELNDTRLATNSIFNALSPQLNSYMQVSFTQHLLSGFGTGPNGRYIRIAKNNREISDVAFRDQVIATVTQIQNIYWDLVNASEDVKVKQRSLALAQKTLDDDRKQVDLQSIPPLDVTRAEVEVENRDQDLSVAEAGLQLQQLLIKNAIVRNTADPAIGDAEIIPADTVEVPAQEPVIPVQDLIAQAAASRPELIEASINLSNYQISRQSAQNALLPQLDAVAYYGGTGLGGDPNLYREPGLPAPPASGLGNALSGAFNNSGPDYYVGLRLNIPLRNRAQQADQVRSELEYRQQQLLIKQLENKVGIEVRNAQFALRQSRSRLDAARKARDLAQQLFAIEQQKLQLGASSSSLVLQAGGDLAVAESNLVAATTVYEKSRVQLDQATGQVLAHSGIQIADAESGVVHKTPHVPGVVTNNEP